MNKKIYIILIVLLSFLIITKCENTTSLPLEINHPDYENFNIDNLLITTYHSDENRGVYSFDELTSNEGYTSTGKEIKLDVLVQEIKNGQVCTECYGYGLVTSNAELTLRGQSSRKHEQKSFQIKIEDDIDAFKGEYVLNLKKHAIDNTRVRNKLAFDLIKDIPNTIVPNTKFVHLTLRDLTNGTGQLEDLGLFTHHEQVDEDFLKRRELDSNCNLYNINNFNFDRYEDIIMLEDNPLYDKNAFEEILEIKGSKDHSSLIELLDAINSPLVPINQVINKYFDRENYLTYLAVNMIVDNADAASRNFKLYSPLDTDKWYFIYWDYDKTFNFDKSTYDEWRRGIHLYMNDLLHEQFLTVDGNRQDLIRKMEELRPYFSKDKVNSLLEEYKPIIKYYLTNSVDSKYIEVTYPEIEAEMDRFYENISSNYDTFYDSLNYPKAVFIGNFEKKSNYYILTWTKSQDFNNEDIHYEVTISKDPYLNDIVYYEDDIQDNQVAIFDFKPGNYFVSVNAVNESNKEQSAYDSYTDRLKNKYFGIKNLVAR